MTPSTEAELTRLQTEAERNKLAALLALAEADVTSLELKLKREAPGFAWTTIAPDLPRPTRGQAPVSYQLAVEQARRDYLAQRYAVVHERAERAAQQRQQAASGIGQFLPTGPYDLDQLIEAAKAAEQEQAPLTLGEQRQAGQAERERQRHAAGQRAAEIREASRHGG